MKKILSLILAAALILSLAACGSKSNGEPTASGGSESNGELTSSGGSENKDELTASKWVNLYTNGTLIFHPDQTMTVSDNEGTWSREGDTISYSYTASDGSEVQQTATITTENEGTVLKSSNGSDYYPEDTVEDARASRSLPVGETVSTDILEITLNDAQLSYYANESLEPTENGGIFTTNKGNTLVRLDFTITNKDRTTLDTQYLSMYFTVLQNENFSTVMGYDPNYPNGQWGLNYAYAFVAEPEGALAANSSSNILLPSEIPLHVIVIGVANFEADDTSAPFYLTANLGNSDKTVEKFMYSIK